MTIMIKLNIDLEDRSYPIYITSDYRNLGKCLLNARLKGRIVVITDTNVDGFQSEECIHNLTEGGFDVAKYVVEAGEKSKNLDTIKDIYKFLIGQRLDRQATLVALGGGVVGDITGFAAATFLRGINFVQVPTSLLAQADSSVGGKVGVDLDGSKNIVGAFYQPKLVYININTLKTLPKREMQAGLAEVVKHGIIRDPDFLDFIEYNVNKIFNYDADTLAYMAKTNCRIKGNVVEQDEKESNLRAILNFGHTIGHAIESVYNFELLHGECVALGMIAAFNLANHLEMVDVDTMKRVREILDKIGLPTRLNGINADKVYAQMFHDKKVKDNKLVFVLPKAIGDVVLCNIEDELLLKKVIGELGE